MVSKITIHPKFIKQIILLGEDIIIKYHNGKELILNNVSFDDFNKIMDNKDKKPIQINLNY